MMSRGSKVRLQLLTAKVPLLLLLLLNEGQGDQEVVTATWKQKMSWMRSECVA